MRRSWPIATNIQVMPASPRPSPQYLLREHRIAFILAGIALLAAAALGVDARAENAPVLAAAIVLLFGMPHGAFDAELAVRDALWDKAARSLKFIEAYIGVAAFVVLFWSFFPGEGLCAFLALSALHFSEDWQHELPSASRLVIGAALIGFPALFHQQTVLEIFAWLVPETDAAFLAAGLHACALALLPLVAAAFAFHLRDRPLAVLEAAVVLALALAASPLTFFLVYFCGLHSIRHLFHVRDLLHGRAVRSLFPLALPYALAACTAIVGAAVMSFSQPFGGAMLGSLFIGLAALTVPHMLLSRD